MQLRTILGAAGLGLGMLGAGPALAEPSQRPAVEVFKSPTCGCCTKWVDHLSAHGFQVETRDLQNLDELKASNGVPRPLRSCHTALVDGYVIEGHVPAADVQRLLRERPRVAGLAVPGMPIGSPGMEGPNPEPYQVWSFGGAEGVVVFSSHAPR